MKMELPTFEASSTVALLSNARAETFVNLSNAKKQNIKHTVYNDELVNRTTILAEVVKFKTRIESLMKMSMHQASQYRESRISFLEKEIERNLAYLLPDEDFKIKIDFRTVSDRHYANLYIGKNGTWSLPKTKNGRFVRQIISFSAMYSVNRLRGSKTLFYDEALSSADAQSLTELKVLMDSLIEDGFQIIMIEHKETLYNKLKRKEIHLVKDRALGNVRILKEEIIDGELAEQ